MTNFIEKLKQVAAGRTKTYGPIRENEVGYSVFPPIKSVCIWNDEDECHESRATLNFFDAKFIATFANCADELVAVVEAANAVIFDCSDDLIRQEKRLREALAKLRQKVEGEGG